MSHIFISYARNDKEYLKNLVAWLNQNGFAEHELWYDQHIDGGSNWRNEIAKALDEAFAVAVIVTPTSMKSLYCTYEWAYALGQGIPVLPLVFENVDITEVPTPLAAKQIVSCVDGIQQALKAQLRQLKSVPPPIAAINRQVYDIVLETHRQFFILGWIGEDIVSLPNELQVNVLVSFASTVATAHAKLVHLMTDKAFALSGKQYRYCWQLVDLLDKISRIQPQYDERLRDDLVARFDTEWLPAFEYFEGDGAWRRWTRLYFERDLSDAHNRMMAFAEMIRAIPDFEAHDVDVLLQNATLAQPRKKKG